ncbi:acetyl-CoA hydrolase/transferase family protein [Ramlibacter sp.]|uniref:acetyl-CoA hydrolase/transferase family protein n=1 Tax=Ramlibacter sp. TaxID=1917967 RepID=UPI003D0B1825
MIVLDRPEDIDFTQFVRPGDMVVSSQAMAEPVALTRRLVEQRTAIGDFRMFIGPSFSGVFKPEHGNEITFETYCGTGENATLPLDVVPAHFSEWPRLFDTGVMPCDVALLTLSEPDADGRFNLGACNDYVVAAARRARVVIAEICANVPWVQGCELPQDIRPHYVVRTGRELVSLERSSKAREPERRIAAHVAGLVPDGATLEIGIGMAPDLVMKALANHRHLGIHTGVISDSMMDLMETGAIDNSRKTEHRGMSVAGLLIGSRRLLSFADRNPHILLMDASRTHDQATLRALPDFIAVNSAIEVDLTGQINSETLDGRYIGAIGGQVDFVRGGNASPTGRSIMILAATGRGAEESRVLARLPDSVVTTARADVDVVVTEFGVAHLRGKSLAARAKAMVELAHPDFRESLARSAHAYGKKTSAIREAYFAQ